MPPLRSATSSRELSPPAEPTAVHTDAVGQDTSDSLVPRGGLAMAWVLQRVPFQCSISGCSWGLAPFPVAVPAA